MFCDLGLQPELLNELDVHRLGPRMSADKFDMIRLTLPGGDEAEFLDSSIHRLLCHCPATLVNTMVYFAEASTYYVVHFPPAIVSNPASEILIM